MRLLCVLFFVCSASLTPAIAPSAHAGALRGCSAKHKRPANLYGSVLSDGLRPALAAAPAAGPAGAHALATEAHNAPASASQPKRITRAEWRASTAPCGSDRP